MSPVDSPPRPVDEIPGRGALRTQFAFVLPRGYVDESGTVQRDGVMRLATARDEILPQRDPRVRENEAYLTMVARGARREGVGLGFDLPGVKAAAKAGGAIVIRTLALQAVLIAATASASARVVAW